MFRSKKAIELSVNFLVMLLIGLVLFGMGIYLMNMIFGGGKKMYEDQFKEFDQQVGELSCDPAESVCIQSKSKMIEKDKMGMFAVTVRNALSERDFKVTVTNTRLVSQGSAPASFVHLELYGMDQGRTLEDMKNREKRTLGIGVKVPKNAASGQYTLELMVEHDDGTGLKDYIDAPYVMFVTVP